MKNRYDLAGAKENVQAAEFNVRAEKSQRLPSLALNANYTGGRIKADIDQARAELVPRKSKYQDLEGRVAYDVRAAQLDLIASESSAKVAIHNQGLAGRALVKSQDRFNNGVTNYLGVVEAQEVFAESNENYVESLFSFNVSKIALARAMGGAETRIQDLFGGN